VVEERRGEGPVTPPAWWRLAREVSKGPHGGTLSWGHGEEVGPRGFWGHQKGSQETLFIGGGALHSHEPGLPRPWFRGGRRRCLTCMYNHRSIFFLFFYLDCLPARFSQVAQHSCACASVGHPQQVQNKIPSLIIRNGHSGLLAPWLGRPWKSERDCPPICACGRRSLAAWPRPCLRRTGRRVSRLEQSSTPELCPRCCGRRRGQTLHSRPRRSLALLAWSGRHDSAWPVQRGRASLCTALDRAQPALPGRSAHKQPRSRPLTDRFRRLAWTGPPVVRSPVLPNQ
jgi:hypothetical protein